jgi:hypothetical protein
MDCPITELRDQIELWPPGQQGKALLQEDQEGSKQSVPPIVPSNRKLICFCLDPYLIGHVSIEPPLPTSGRQV